MDVQVVDWSLGVNVEFMLCPTGAMLDIFPMLPQILLLPSYRTTLTIAVLIVGALVAHTYMAIAKLFQLFFAAEKKHHRKAK